MPGERTEVRRQECRDAGCPIATGNYRCAEHDSRGTVMHEHSIKLGVGSWMLKSIVIIGLGIFGTLAALHWRIGAVQEEMSIIATRQVAVLKELDRLGTRVDKVEDHRPH